MSETANAESEGIPSTVESLTADLRELFSHNSSASIELFIPDKKIHVVKNGWNDSSIILYIPSHVKERRNAFFSALNHVILPERLSAIYHRDTKALEVIWTAYKMPEHLEEVKDRSFDFSYGNKTYPCHFTASSERLLTIAHSAILAGFSETGHRSLKSFEKLTNPQRPARNSEDVDRGEASLSNQEIGEATSFFISDVEWDSEEAVLDLIRHLNFYLKYFDSQSPTVRIHEPNATKSYSERGRYLEGEFPSSINGKALNPTLMSFWLAAGHGDASRRFLYYFRIIEYVAFYHLDAQARTKMARLLSIPNPSGNAGFLTEKATEIIREATKPDDYARFKATILDLVMPHHIEREAAVNPEYFSTEQIFDGGFKLKPFFSDKKNSTIGPHGLDTFVTMLRDIRNALSHGRDQKSGQVILPTSANFNTLKPWVDLIATAAAEVVLYERMS